ncbi:MAG: crotonase/enoyl-CoA hydratase family protein [Alphaproteobacteria bacterium]
MDYAAIKLDIRDNIAHLVFNRPEAMNAMNRDMWREIPDAINAIDVDGSARVIVISAAGKHFTAGMDLSVFGQAGPYQEAELGRRRSHLRTDIMRLQDCFTAFERARMPVIAAVQGGCIGAGVDMITACDMRYATADAFFCIQEINIGITADVGTLQRLPKIIAPGIARELSYTGRRMPANEAKACGLINEVFVNQAEMLEGVMAVAREIAAKSPLAIAGTKEMLNYARDHSVADGLNHNATWQAGMFYSQDIKEAMASRAEKREPKFENILPIKGSMVD